LRSKRRRIVNLNIDVFKSATLSQNRKRFRQLPSKGAFDKSINSDIKPGGHRSPPVRLNYSAILILIPSSSKDVKSSSEDSLSVMR